MWTADSRCTASDSHRDQGDAFAGSWRFGLLVTGLKDGASHLLRDHRFTSDAEHYANDTYEATATSPLLEMTQSPPVVVEALVGQLLRSLGSHEMLDWLPR
jgi:hypothetical protein